MSLRLTYALAVSSLVAALGLGLIACLVHYAREAQGIFQTTVLARDRLATALRLNEDKLALLEEKLTDEKIRSVNSARKVALGEMAGGIAHEINNPLAIIRCYVDFIEIETKKAMGQNAQVTKAVAVMGRAVDRMADIVSDLRKLNADDHRSQHKPVQLDEILASAIQFCQRRFLTHNVALEITRIPDDVMVSGEREQLIQVLLNLLQNSFKEVSHLEDSWIKVDYKISGERIQIRVTDSGKGIDDAIAEKIFQPFFTTRVVGKGVGLGLSVSLGIVESHSGSLFLDRAHTNTRFVIELPILKCDKELQQTA
jgi:C4-dicarboxylate-specific signal transduction histidine kinase